MLSPLEVTSHLLARRLYAAKRPVLWASGGKDSMTLLHLCQPWARKLTVLHATVDDGWPGVTENLVEQCAAWHYPRLTIVKPWMTFEAYVERYGWPVDIVPTALEGATAVVQSVYRTTPIKVSSWWHCSFVRGIYPLMLATAEHQADVVLTGSRLADAPDNAIYQAEIATRHPAGWQRLNPLSEWTTADIWAYIDAQQIQLSPHYAWKRYADYESVDCMSCTLHPQHWATLQQHYPEEYARRWPTVQPVYEALYTALAEGAEACRLLLPPTSWTPSPRC